jgi:NAD(P)-dependent dehydrogenase (short-subunit alcohol dehydrogenase family)/carbon monoxide dehydrogenase subunit G
MTVLHETADVRRPVEEVFAYVSDFTTTTEWDATALSATKLTPGELGVGTEFEVVCALPVGSINLRYRIAAFEHPNRLELEGSCRFFNIRDTITFAPSKRGTRIDYRAEFDFKSLLRPLISMFTSGLEKMGRESVAGLASALEDNYPPPAEPKKNLCSPAMVRELPLFTRLGYRLGRKKFSPMSASVRGKHMVVTGASAGLGYTTALELARRGADLTLVMRDKARAEQTVATLQAETGNVSIEYELADLSLMSEVDSLIDRLNRKNKAIDVLVNNAGALFNPRSETTEGHEQSYALLLLSPYRLTMGLKPLLLKAASSRVINVVSGGMYSQRLQVDRLLNDSASEYSGSVAYAREKRALMVLTEEWAREWAQDGIVVNAMHPGWADTPGVKNALPEFRKITRSILRSSEEGADTIVWLAVASEVGKVSGKLFLDRQIKSPYLLKNTRENEAERQKLMNFLGQEALLKFA